ncbi:hypothetical protein B0H63DRAFT_545682 [Podospora didyma]|uniref:Uncharacterized protein n=1 Tax=Podospora didyma TaxID=330526 RepID=A0AAE0NGW1_9PEZI|nr:hypothetical protein B0H63DRAFT_545682 [Podospora didyma]
MRHSDRIRFPVKALLISTCFIVLVFHFQRRRDFRNGLSEGVPIKLYSSPEPVPVDVVVASMKHEDTERVHKHLPTHWRTTVYVVDDPTASLTVPENKGREAMAYLTCVSLLVFLSLAETTLFIHASRFAWHNDDPDHDAVASLRNLNIAHIQESGFVNLRCVWTLGCPAKIWPHQDATGTLKENSDDDAIPATRPSQPEKSSRKPSWNSCQAPMCPRWSARRAARSLGTRAMLCVATRATSPSAGLWVR